MARRFRSIPDVMRDYRTFLTGLVAVFLALGLGMLIGSTIVGAPPPQQQMQMLKGLQQDFSSFRQENTQLRALADDTRARLQRQDQALRQVLPRYLGHRLMGKDIAIILCGQQDDSGYLSSLEDVLQKAGGTVVSTTRIADDWLPLDEEARRKVVDALHVPPGQASNASIAAAVARSIASGNDDALKGAAQNATGLRLEGDYDQPVDGVLVISSTRTPERYQAAHSGDTPESGLLSGLQDARGRVVLAEPDGDETLTTIPLWMRSVPATVDNIDMAGGQLSAVYALAGRDGRFGLKRSAERAIPEVGP